MRRAKDRYDSKEEEQYAELGHFKLHKYCASRKLAR
jgi:hypothetical protein